MPKLMDAVEGMFNDIQYSASAEAIDPFHSDERMIKKVKMGIEQDYGLYFDKLLARAGKTRAKPEYIPKSLEELKIMEIIGDFKLKNETGIEKIIDYALDKSDWEEIERKMLNDYATFNMCGAKVYVDKRSQTVQIRYVNPNRAVFQYNRDSNFSKTNYAGEFVDYTFANLIAEEAITREEIEEVVQTYKQVTSGLYIYKNYNNKDQDNSNNAIILDFEFPGVETRYKKKSNGVVLRRDKLKKSELKGLGKDDSKFEKVQWEVWYKCKHIVGTEIVWDFGVQTDISRDVYQKAQSMYKFFKNRVDL